MQVTLPRVFFKCSASKNQLPSLSVSGTLVENGLRKSSLIKCTANSWNNNFTMVKILLAGKPFLHFMWLKNYKKKSSLKCFNLSCCSTSINAKSYRLWLILAVFILGKLWYTWAFLTKRGGLHFYCFKMFSAN